MDMPSHFYIYLFIYIYVYSFLQLYALHCKQTLHTFIHYMQAYDKFMGGGIWGAGTAALVYGVASLSIDADNAEDFQHRY